MASFANAGLYSMLLSGLCLELIGPRYNLLIGGLLSAIGYIFVWSIATLQIPSSISGACLSLYLATFGTSFFSITCTALMVANYPPRDRGKAVGIMKAFLGLGISINSQFYSTFFGDLDYLLGLAIVMPLTAVLGASVVNFIPRQHLEYSKEEEDASAGGGGGAGGGGKKVRFWNWFLLIAVTAVYVGVATFLDEDISTLPQWGNDLLFIPTVLLMMVGLAFFPFQYGPAKRVLMITEQEQDEAVGLLAGKPVLPPEILGDEGREENDFRSVPKHFVDHVCCSPQDKRSSLTDQIISYVIIVCKHSLLAMLQTLEFWLLFFVFAMGAGVCLTVLNNIAGMVDAYNSSEGTAVPLVLFGLFETAGRLSVSLTDVFRTRIARVFILDVVLVILFLCCLLLAYANLVMLNICIILISYCYGFLYANISAIVADLFGVRHFGGNLGFSLFAPILGSFAWASGVVDLFYQGDGCTDSSCYRYVFLTDAVTCLIATVLCLFLKLRIMDRFQVASLAEVFERRVF